MGKFEITRRKNRQFQYNLKAENGEIILTSQGYTAKHNCHKAIESVRKNSGLDTQFDKKRSKDKQYYFTLKAANGAVIGVSEMYKAEDGMMTGIESVKQNAPDAEIVDLTVKS